MKKLGHNIFIINLNGSRYRNVRLLRNSLQKIKSSDKKLGLEKHLNYLTTLGLSLGLENEKCSDYLTGVRLILRCTRLGLKTLGLRSWTRLVRFYYTLDHGTGTWID